MYKYFQYVETKKFNVYQKTLIIPIKPRFHSNWEWKYDFPEIRRKFYQLLLFYFQSFVIWLLNVTKFTEYPCYYEASMNEISVDDIKEFIYKNVKDTKYFYSQECMIIFGPDVRADLKKITSSFELSVNFHFQANIHGESLLFFQDIPLVYVPTVSGIHILPDVTGHWKERIEKAEPTAYGRLRRY